MPIPHVYTRTWVNLRLGVKAAPTSLPVQVAVDTSIGALILNIDGDIYELVHSEANCEALRQIATFAEAELKGIPHAT